MEMHPIYPVVPPYLQNNLQRSWSDEHIPVNSYSKDPPRPALRASSFSASQAPQPQWKTHSTPPPVPPLPPSLLPGFYSPPSAHATIDFAFTESPCRPLVQHLRRPGPPSNVPSSSHDFTPSLPRQVINSTSPWPPIDQRNHFPPSFHFAPPPPPPISYGYIPKTQTLGCSHPSSHTLSQSFTTHLEHSLSPPSVHSEARLERSPSMNFQAVPSLPSAAAPPRSVSAHGEVRFKSSPTMNFRAAPSLFPVMPPVVPPRPVSAHGEVRFERSPTMGLQAAPSPPSLPPKPSTSPPEYTPTPSGQVIISPPFDPQPIPEQGLSTKSPPPEAQVPETSSLDSDLKPAMTLPLRESHREVETTVNEGDDELARALAESSSISAPMEHIARKHLQADLTVITQSPVKQDNPLHHAQYLNGVSGTSSRRRPSFLNLGGIEILSPEELEDHAAHGQIMQTLEDEEVTRRLQEEEEKRMAAELREREKEGEEVARQLQEAEEQRLAAESRERERADEERAKLDAAFTKRLQEEEAMRSEAEKREREQQDEAWTRMAADIARKEAAKERAEVMQREAQERQDAEMARRMAETNDTGRGDVPQKVIREAQDRKDADIARRMTQSNGVGQVYAPYSAHPPHVPALLSRAPGPPQYNDIVVASAQPTRPTARTVQSSPQTYNGSPQPIPRRRAASAFAREPVRPAEQGNPARLATAYFSGSVRHSDDRLKPKDASTPSLDPSPGYSNSARPSTSSSRTSPSVGPIVVPEHNVPDADLLKGISYGFTVPDTHSVPSQPEGLRSCLPFPEVISLHLAPSPPFYIMATSWRHLLRLLGRLETRIQANINAIAQSKEEYTLRVVVQFAKLPCSVTTWGTILHLTLDHPIPRDAQNAWRNKNKDTTTLPYSYTLGEPTPYLVNNLQSQLYVIPLSAASPFPILPISLPNLGLYLQSVMRDSRMRKVQNDPSNGMRRLAKMVADCYPEEAVAEQAGRKRGVGNLFKRVVGLGGAREASQVNEDVYDIITPFRIDQYATS